MPRIPKQHNKITISNVMKQKRLEEARRVAKKQNDIKLAKALEFDKFVKETAKSMIEKPSKIRLQVFDASATPKIIPTPSDISVWAPWNHRLV